MDAQAVTSIERWTAVARFLATASVLLGGLGFVLGPQLASPRGATSVAWLGVAAVALAARATLSSGGEGPRGSGTALRLAIVVGSSAGLVFATHWSLDVPMLTVHRAVALPPGAGAAHAVARYALAEEGALVLLALALAVLSGAGYRWLRPRVAGLDRIVRIGAVVLGVGGLLIATLAESRSAAKREPTQLFEELPVEARLGKADRYELQTLEGRLQLLPTSDSRHKPWCRVGDTRQPTDAECAGVQVQHEPLTGLWLAQAQTAAGLEPIVWCTPGDRGLDCPDVLAWSDLTKGVATPRYWRWLAFGAAIAGLLAMMTGMRWVRADVDTGTLDEATAKTVEDRLLVLALVCTSVGSVPVLVAALAGFV